MKIFMTNKEYRRSIEEAIQNNKEQEDLWAMHGKIEDLQYKVQGLEQRIRDLETRLTIQAINPTWSGKTVDIQKTDITC